MKLFLVSFFLMIALLSSAQTNTYSAYYYQRVSLFEELPITSDDIVFLGNSITDGGEWHELLADPLVKNRGISGDITSGLLDRLDPILEGAPAKLFLLIGINDLSRGVPVDSIILRIGLIICKIKEGSPTTKIYLQSILPVNDCYNKFTGHTSRWDSVSLINSGLKKLAEKERVVYIDLYSSFIEEDTGKMNPDYTNDGLHLMGPGYEKWAEIVLPYVKE